MIGLFKRSNGIYYLHFTDASGRRKWRSTHSTRKTDALSFLRTFSPTTKKSSLSPLDLLGLIEKNFARIYREENLELYRFSLRALSRLVPGVTISNLSKLNIQDFTRDLLVEMRPITANKYLRTLRSAFNHAKTWDLIQGNPFARVHLVPIPERSPAFFLRREISAVIADLRSRGLDLDAEIATIGLHTGLRRGEILSLSWEDVDLDRGILRVRSSESYKVKGGRIRVVPINDTAGEILSRRVNSRGVIFSGVLPETLSRRFKKSVRRLHLREDLHFHSLRHTYASWLVQKGVSLYVVQRLLGHSSPTMTQVYAHLAPEDLRTHVRLLEDHHEDPGENSSE